MLKLYKDWFLDADPYQYIVGKVKERTRDGRTAQEFINPSYHPTIAAAVGHELTLAELQACALRVLTLALLRYNAEK